LKKLFPILGILFLCSLPFLYGQTITLPGMTETTTISANDLLWVWLDPAGTNATRKIKASNLLKRNHACEIVIGNPNSAGAVLADGDDAPAVCGNVSGADQTITAVACRADAAGASVLPILTGGGTIVTGAITCGNGTWAAGTVSGTPTIKTFSANGATCAATPCTVDAAIATAGGSARYAIIRFTISGL
jgi:hypothetical protein